MMILLKELGYLLLLYLPVGALILWLVRRKRRQKLQAVPPFKELQRRPAGESNRLRIEELNEKMDPWLGTVIITPLLLAVWLTLTKASWVVVLLFFLCSAGSCAIAYAR